MPTTEFAFKELCRLLGKRYKPAELRDHISMLGVDVERMDEEKIIMEVFPNRPDLLGIEGFARALKGIIDIESGLPEYSAEPSGMKVYVDPSVKKVRPYIVCGVIKGVSLDECSLISLMNIQEKLHITHGRNRRKVAIGVHDLSKIEAPFTYKAVKPHEISFVPLDSTEEMDMAEILERHPKGKAYKNLLEGFDRYPVIVDNKNRVVSFPPIINGDLTRLTEKTQDLFIDVTGTDEKAISQALSILVTSILDNGGKAYTVDITAR